MSNERSAIAELSVRAGERGRLELPVGRLPTGSQLSVPVEVLRGVRPGPTIWLSGAIHGDEIVGVEIIRQVLEKVDQKDLAGVLIAVPVVNVYGFVSESRYLPDRRDLNRCFPGSRNGSLAAQLARIFLDEVVELCDFGVDFHAGSGGRTNLPQIRGDMKDPETRRLAVAFGAPLAIHGMAIHGSLREAVLKRGKRTLLFEGGEPGRFSPRAVDAGVAGTLRVLSAMGMTEPEGQPTASVTRLAWSTRWVRAGQGGIFRLESTLGARVAKGEHLGTVSAPGADDHTVVEASVAGTILGHKVHPLVHRGDALVHIALDDDGESGARPGTDTESDSESDVDEATESDTESDVDEGAEPGTNPATTASQESGRASGATDGARD